MKLFLQRITFVVLLLFPSFASATLYQQTWTPVTGTGPLAPIIDHTQFGSVPSAYTLDWADAGTAPASGTFQAEGSTDGVHWFALTAATDFTASGMLHIVNKPVLKMRINILTYTQGDGTTAVIFHYTRGQ